MSKVGWLETEKVEDIYSLIKKLREEIKELESEIEETNRQIRFLENKLKEKDAELNKIYEGGSWIV